MASAPPPNPGRFNPGGFRLSYGKVKEFQRRAVVHFHALVRLDGRDPDDQAAIVTAPAGIDAHELKAAIAHAAAHTAFRSPPHPTKPEGWLIAWGEQLETRIVTVAANGEITKEQVGGYLAKYATKSTEVTGHLSSRLTEDTIDLYADEQGSHTERLIDACWYLGRADGYQRLRRHAHQLGFGGHFFTKSHRFTATFGYLKHERLTWTRRQTTGPTVAGTDVEPDVLVLNFLEFVGAGWHTTGDAILANTSAAMAREQRRVAREEMAALAAAPM